MPRPGDDDHYDENQPRVPKGFAGGGRWTDGDDQGEPSKRSSESLVERDGIIAERFLDKESGAVVRSEYATPGSKEWDRRYTATLPNGGVFTYEKSGSLHRVYENGRLAGTYKWTEDGLVPEPVLHLAYQRPPSPGRGGAVVAGALAVYRALMAQSWRQDGSVVGLGYDVEAMLKGEKGDGPAAVPFSLTRDEAMKGCPKYGEVQGHLDRAIGKVRATERKLSAQQFGTIVHAEFDHAIKRQGDPNLVSEYSILKAMEENPTATREQVELDARRGMGGTLRYDAIENVEGKGKRYCAYDPKTGKAGLTPARMGELAHSAAKHFAKLFGPPKWIYVIEMRLSPK